MTNTEYETASVQAAMGHRKLAAVDKQIEQVESTLVFLLHSRREIVNKYDLNKPKCRHGNALYAPGLYFGEGDPNNRRGSDYCTDCGSRIEI